MATQPKSGVSTSKQVWNGAAVAAVAVVLFAYAVVFAYLSPLMLQDNPNHNARAVVMADLMFRHGREFGRMFDYHFLMTPYVLGDLILASLVRLLGTPMAVALWAGLVFLAFPCGLFAYMRAKRIALDATLFMVLLSAYLSTDAFFVLGFMAFRLSVSLVLLALAAAELLRRRWSGGGYAAFVVGIVLAYLTHFAAVVFIATALGASALVRLGQRTAQIRREVYLLLPLACTLVWQLLIASGYRQTQDGFTQPFEWGTPVQKLENLFWGFRRYTPATDLLLGCMLVAAVLMWVWPVLRRRIPAPHSALETCALAVTFLGLYLIFPLSYSEGGFIDVRALAFVPAFIIVGALNLAEHTAEHRKRLAFGCAMVLAALNLTYLARHLQADDRQLALYRAVVAGIPPRSRVLPIYTVPREGMGRPFLHAASFAVTDRDALIPYLFSADVGSPMKYFRYVHRPYAPHEEWYLARLRAEAHYKADPEISPEVDWTKVADQYQFLLVTKPFDATRISISTRLVKQNSAAALLAIN